MFCVEQHLRLYPPPLTLATMTNSRVRLNAYHNAKSRLVGSRAAHVSPAWRATNIPVAVQTQMKTQVNRSTLAVLPGAGKILINNLPVDVMLEEIVVGNIFILTRNVDN